MPLWLAEAHTPFLYKAPFVRERKTEKDKETRRGRRQESAFKPDNVRQNISGELLELGLIRRVRGSLTASHPHCKQMWHKKQSFSSFRPASRFQSHANDTNRQVTLGNATL
jgi:hypothetical protein